MQKIGSFFARIYAWIKAHKIWSAVIAVLIVGIGYGAYAHYAASTAASEYVIAPVIHGTLTQTVTGSGQVAANQSIDLSPKASGEVTSVNVKAGQVVARGATIATIDDTTAAQSVEDAKTSLESAQIAYQQSLMSTETSAEQAKGDAFSAASSALTDISSTLKDLNDALYEQSTIPQHTDQQNIDAYGSVVGGAGGDSESSAIKTDYAAAKNDYGSALTTVTGMSPDSSDADIQDLASVVYNAAKAAATVTGETHAIMTEVNDKLTINKETTPTFTSQFTTISNDSSKMNSDVSNTYSASQTLASALATGTTGATLDIQSAQLTLQRAQDSYDEAETALSDYFVTAPFSGTIAKVDVQQYDQASSGTTVATLVTDEEYADLSLNEVDAEKVQDGQKATLTFDAIQGLTISGTVAEIDSIGTVSQGVVTYDVKISFDTQDARVKPGMTVDATITTGTATDALIVPSSAVTTIGNQSFVQVVTMGGPTASTTASSTGGFNRQRFASSTSQGTSGFGTNTSTPRFAGQGFASSTGRFASSTGFSGAGGFGGNAPTDTVDASTVTVMRVPVTIGLTNDTQTQILTGVNAGEFIVVSTKTGSATSATTGTTAGRTTTGGFGAGGGAARGGFGGGGAAVFRAGG